MFTRSAFLLLLTCLLGTTALAEKPTFEKHRIGTYRSESCCVGDFNNDDKLDIIAGPYLYLAPDWKQVEIRQLNGKVSEEGKGYMDDFMNAAVDVDGDGLLDVVACTWFQKRSVWYRNPGESGGPWAETVIEAKDNFEQGDPWDLDGDGLAVEIVPATRHTCWYELGKLDDGTQGYIVHMVSEKKLPFGSGVGDINGDGRNDIIRTAAWYEAPEDIRNGEWKEHPISLGRLKGDKPDHTPQILVHDVNGDGHNDIITSVAHGYGIMWYEQVPAEGDGESTWNKHVIDDTWSQAHSLTLADIDGDGDLDLATGKRFMAHNGGDPGAGEPLQVCWYEFEGGSEPKWTQHVISAGEGIGSALNIPVIDLDGDGDLDIVVTGKWGGPVWFENKMK